MKRNVKECTGHLDDRTVQSNVIDTRSAVRAVSPQVCADWALPHMNWGVWVCFFVCAIIMYVYVYMYVYMYVSLCVCTCIYIYICVCVCVWERERERERENYTQDKNYHVNVFEFIRYTLCLVGALLVYVDGLYPII